jgi:N-acetylneuraminic acid mutarotase
MTIKYMHLVTHVKYMMRRRSWSVITSMPTPRAGASGVVVDEVILVLGGYDLGRWTRRVDTKAKPNVYIRSEPFE